VTHYVLFFIDITRRAVKIAGITPHPDSRWMTQIARNLTDLNDGFLRGKRYLIFDRDTKYCHVHFAGFSSARASRSFGCRHNRPI
jgi:putative transposase